MADAAAAWQRFVSVAEDDFSRAELQALSLETLQALLPHYGFAGATEVGLIEAHWQQLRSSAPVSLAAAAHSAPRKREDDAKPRADVAQTGAGQPLISPYRPPDPPVTRITPQPRQANGARTLAESTSPVRGEGGCVHGAEFVLVKYPGDPLGMEFAGDGLLFTACIPGGPASRHADIRSAVGTYVTHCNGVPVASLADLRCSAEHASSVHLRFGPPPAPPPPVLVSPAAPTALLLGAPHRLPDSRQRHISPQRDRYAFSSPAPESIPLPQHPAIKSPCRGVLDTAEESVTPVRGAQRRRSRQSAVHHYPVEHPQPFEVPKPRRSKSLGRRRRLAPDGLATSNPNTAAGGRGDGARRSGRGAAAPPGAGGEPEEQQWRPSVRSVHPQSCPAYRDPTLVAGGGGGDMGDEPEGRGRRAVQPAGDYVNQDLLTGGGSADTRRGKKRVGGGDENTDPKQSDKVLRQLLGRKRQGYLGGVVGGSNPNPDLDGNTGERRSRAAAAAGQADAHGPPGIWPDGGFSRAGPQRRQGVAVDTGGGVLPGTADYCDGFCNDAPPKPRRCVSPEAIRQQQSSIEPEGCVMVSTAACASQPDKRGLRFIASGGELSSTLARRPSTHWTREAKRDALAAPRHVAPPSRTEC